jgi:hypothetical protein
MKTPDPTEEIKTVRHQLGAELDFDLHGFGRKNIYDYHVGGTTNQGSINTLTFEPSNNLN